ncbi:MAG: hypothetical protein HKN22_03685 [Bacteroidia bacterium]|nr:hypothetical protein [Bacteroidia bacterium]
MSKKLARFISFVFHPLLMPTYAILLLINMNSYLAYSMPPELQRIVLGIIFFTTFALPFLMAMFYIQKGMVSNIYMVNAKERTLPYLTAAIFYFGGYYLLTQLPIPRLFSWVILAAAVSIIVASLINVKWKISIHMLGVGALGGLIFSLPQLMLIEVFRPFVLVILLAGIIGTARLVSGRHTIGQISAGYILGFTLEWLVLRYSDLLI